MLTTRVKDLQNGADKGEHDLLGTDFFNNPHPYYDFLRREQPVYWHAPKEAWLVTRYEDVST